MKPDTTERLNRIYGRSCIAAQRITDFTTDEEWESALRWVRRWSDLLTRETKAAIADGSISPRQVTEEEAREIVRRASNPYNND